jgi:uncharacterized protein
MKDCRAVLLSRDKVAALTGTMLERLRGPRAIYSADAVRGWMAWGAFAPFLALVLVGTSLETVLFTLRHFHLVDEVDGPVGPLGLVTFLFFPLAALGLVVFAWVRFVERRTLATIGLVPFDRAKRFVRGHLVGMAMVCLVAFGIWVAGGFEVGSVGRALHSPRALVEAVVLLAGFAVQSSVEEIVFRGWLLSLVAHRLNLVWAVVLSSTAFTLLHYEGSIQPPLFTLNVFLFAIFACFWALRYENVWGVMGWHAGWNGLFVIGFELRITGLDAHLPALLVKLTPKGPRALTGGAEGPEGSVVCTLLVLGAIAILAWGALRADQKVSSRGSG